MRQANERWLAALAMLPLGTALAQAPAQPQLLRYDDDHAALGAPCAEGDAWACLKQIEWGEHVTASFGGEFSLRVEAQRNGRFGATLRGEDVNTLQRGLVFGDVSIGEHVRVFAQLSSAIGQGRRGGDLPTDENRAEWQNAFLELRSPLAEGRVGLRLGQQELRFGNARLIDAREGLNVRRSFAGVRAWWTQGLWRTDALDVRPRLDRAGGFDDERSDTQRLRGLYATRGGGAEGLDVYLLRLDDRAARTAEGLVAERRHTSGLRWFGAQDGWEWNLEAAVQRGDAGAAAIRADALMLEGDYGQAHWPGTLRLGLMLNQASGDARRGDGELGTFNPLYARGNLLDEDATLALRNLRSAQITAEFSPLNGWFVQASAGRFWRDQTSDGVYRPGGLLLTAAGASQEREVADTLSVLIDGHLSRRWGVVLKGAVLVPGDFLRDEGLNERFLFGEAMLRFRF